MTASALVGLSGGGALAQPNPDPVRRNENQFIWTYPQWFAQSVNASSVSVGSIDAGVVAENGVRACLLAGDQTIAGSKVFSGLMQNTSTFPRNLGTHSVNVSAIFYNGLMVGTGPIAPTYDDDGITLESRRGNASLAPGVLIRSANFRDAGSYFAVNSGLPCDSSLFSIAASGDVVFAASPDPDCSQSDDVLDKGVLTDGTSASGHVALQSYDKLYLHVRGRLAANHDAMQEDGGRPVADGGITVQTESDGGTYYPYAGSHGNFTVSTSQAQYGGWLLELRNANSVGGNTKFIVDSFGGFTNSHGLVRAAFPPCPGASFQTSLGQFSYGVSPGTQLWADDTEHYYVCKAAGWKQLADEDDLP